jgi:beta-galactosidase
LVASGRLPELDIEPRQTADYTLALPKLDPKPGVEYWLNISFRLKQATSWAPLGHEISWEQFPLPASAPAPAFEPTKTAKLEIQEEGQQVTFKGSNFTFRFDKEHAAIQQYRYKGVTLLERGPLPDFWRAPTNNDRGAWKSLRDRAARDRSLDIGIWRDAGPEWQIKQTFVERLSDSSARVVVRASLPSAGATYNMTYTVYGTGDIVVDCGYMPGPERLAMMPRFGTELVVPAGLEKITWYGRGPKETLIDRRFERVGVYDGTVDEQWVDYMRPQENGSKTDVRWVTLTNPQGVGLMAVGSPSLGVSARHYTKEDMENAGYTFQMKRHPEIYLNLDWKMMGAGGIDSWSGNAYPMQSYRIPSGEEHTYRYRLSPVDSPDGGAKALEKF